MNKELLEKMIAEDEFSLLTPFQKGDLCGVMSQYQRPECMLIQNKSEVSILNEEYKEDYDYYILESFETVQYLYASYGHHLNNQVFYIGKVTT